MAKKLRIALEELRWAFDDRTSEYSWVLDTETGAVLRLAEDDELPLSIEEIEEDETGRFLGIDPEDPHEGYRDMEEFIATVADSSLRDLLDVAIAGKGAFRRFKDVLTRAPQERERWFRFQDDRVNMSSNSSRAGRAASSDVTRRRIAGMAEISNPDRVVFPEIGRTKGDVVAYYERIASRALPHVLGRPLSIRRYPKGLAAPGFFQKNVPDHYPESIERFAVPRSRAASKKHPSKGGKDQDFTVYPVVRQPEHLAYLANQGAIELHVPTSRAADLFHPDRLVIDLDPPPGPFAGVRRAAYVVRDALAEHGLASVPVAT
ncbi:MAG TPA: UPF0158 family protein, partial [Thermoanaerobaculia bacterium]|nr:UPF0158 family protein [Thermoanaerobaculia bacterium]